MATPNVHALPGPPSAVGTTGPSANVSGGIPLTIGGRTIDLSSVISRFSRTFLCIGPICLRSGVGFGAGVGCGAGIGRGAHVFKLQTSPSGGGGSGGFQMPYQLMQQIPGGYQMINVLKTVLRKFPGSQAGVGCGVGVGYGFGVGLQYGAAGGGGGGERLGGGMGDMMSGMQGGGMMGGGLGGAGLMGGSMMGGRGAVGGSTGTSTGSGSAATAVAATVAAREAAEKYGKLEKRIAELEDKVGLQLKMKDLEERLSSVEQGGRRRR
jgi:hypothetical protein